MRYRRYILLVSSLLLLVLVGCSKPVEPIKVPLVEEEEVIEEETYPVEEDTLEKIREKLQEEMRIFDVVEHHDDIYALVSAEISMQDSNDVMNEKIGNIVKAYMDLYLDGRIREELSAVESQYDPDDVQYLRDHIRTDDLYELITIYEREYFKHTND